jgi:hypothetical protein
MRQQNHMPGKVRKRILDRCAKNEPVVVVPRNGMPSRCYGVEEYQKMQAHPHRHEPWKQRRAARAQADPLGAIEGTVLSTIRREEIYE